MKEVREFFLKVLRAIGYGYGILFGIFLLSIPLLPGIYWLTRWISWCWSLY